MSDDEIRQLVGVVEFIDYDSSGSAAAFGGLRSEKMWILKVNGDKGCIYIHAVLDDTFPDYRVISVEPEKSQQSRVQHCSQI